MRVLDVNGVELKPKMRVRDGYGMVGPITKMVSGADYVRGVVGIHIAWDPPYQHQFHWRHAGRRRFHRNTYRCPDLQAITEEME